MVMLDLLIDTSILIDMLRQEKAALDWIKTIRGSTAGLSTIVWLEVLRGARDRREMGRLLKWLAGYELVHLNEIDSAWAIEQFAKFWPSHGIDYADCLIAATAARTGLPLYTRNLKHYAPLPDVNALCPY